MKMMNMKTAREQMPDIGDKIETPDGLGRVVSMNILERVLRIELNDPQRVLDYTLEEIINHAENPVQWSGQ